MPTLPSLPPPSAFASLAGGAALAQHRPEVGRAVVAPAGGARRGEALVGGVAVGGQVADVVVHVVGAVGHAGATMKLSGLRWPLRLRPHSEMNVPAEPSGVARRSRTFGATERMSTKSPSAAGPVGAWQRAGERGRVHSASGPWSFGMRAAAASAAGTSAAGVGAVAGRGLRDLADRGQHGRGDQHDHRGQ